MGVLGASSLSYAEATWTETLPDWIGANVRAMEAVGGAPALFLPNNAKVAVFKGDVRPLNTIHDSSDVVCRVGNTKAPKSRGIARILKDRERRSATVATKVYRCA